MIVLVTSTIQSGTVVRWYLDEGAVETHAQAMSASREGVVISTYLHLIPDAALKAANEAYFALSADSDADVGHLATHRREGLFGPAVPVETQEGDTE